MSRVVVGWCGTLLALLLALVTPGVASASTGAIVDDAGVLSSAEESGLASAAQAITGVRVYLVTDQVTSGSLEGALHAKGSAAGWTGDDWQHDAVILALGEQSREIGVYYGSDSVDRLEPAVDAITDAMTADFRSSDWADGFRSGIHAVDRALRGTLPLVDTSDQEDSGSDSSKAWIWVPVVILVIGSLAWRAYRRSQGGSGDDYYDGDDYSDGDGYSGSSYSGRSGYRRRSRWGSSRSTGGWSGGGSGSGGSGGGWFGGSGGGSSRRSGGSSRRSSGGSSRRSSGGSSRRSSGGGRSSHF